MSNLSRKRFDKNLAFVAYARKQRLILKECIAKYPALFHGNVLQEFDSTIRELYLYNKEHNIFEYIEFKPFRNSKQLLVRFFLEEQINPELLKKEVNSTLKSQILAVDNLYKFFNTLANSPLKSSSLGVKAAFYIKNDIDKLSEELNSLYGLGKATGVKGLYRQGVGLFQRAAGSLSQRGSVQESWFDSAISSAKNVGRQSAESISISFIASKLGPKLERFKSEEDGIRNDILEVYQTYGVRPTLQLLSFLAKQYGLPLLIRVLRTALANSPAAQVLVAGLSSTTGLAAVGGAVAVGGATYAADKFLEARANKIKNIRAYQEIVQDFLDDAVDGISEIKNFNVFKELADAYPELEINVKNYERIFNNDVNALKQGLTQTQKALKPFYYQTNSNNK